METKTFKVDYPVITLFALVTLATAIGVPAFAYASGFTAVDWITFGVLYLTSGLGITVGYHRLISHRALNATRGSKPVYWSRGDGQWRTLR